MVWLVSHAANAALRAGTFAVTAREDAHEAHEESEAHEEAEALDARSAAAMEAWRERWLARIGRSARVIASPAAIAVATARAAGFAAAGIERSHALAEAGFGAWQGRRLADIAQEAPDALAAWTRDAAFRPPGGESFDDVRARLGAWLDALASQSPSSSSSSPSSPCETVVAFASASVLRAAILHALEAPSASWRAIEIAPLDVVLLRRAREGWVWVAHPA